VFSDVKEGKVVVSRAWRARLSPRPVFFVCFIGVSLKCWRALYTQTAFLGVFLVLGGLCAFLQRLGVGLVACMYVCRPSSQVMSYGRWIRKDIMLSFFAYSFLGLCFWNLDTSWVRLLDSGWLVGCAN
jgi:predicted membrane-bound mannosyltransferase